MSRSILTQLDTFERGLAGSKVDRKYSQDVMNTRITMFQIVSEKPSSLLDEFGVTCRTVNVTKCTVFFFPSTFFSQRPPLECQAAFCNHPVSFRTPFCPTPWRFRSNFPPPAKERKKLFETTRAKVIRSRRRKKKKKKKRSEAND